MIKNKNIKLSCTDSDNSTVTFKFDAFEMSTFEMFMKWVCFMNAIGYVFDPEEMEEMWNGIK